MTNLTETQLKSALTNDQIVKAKSRGLAEDDTVDPVAEEIEAAIAKVDTYVAGWLPPAALLTGYARDLAAHQVAKRLDTPTDAQVRAYERALLELEGIRDGKFPQIPRDPDATPTTGKVKKGSRKKIL